MFGLINMVNDGGYGSGAYTAPSYTAPSYIDGSSTLSYSSPTNTTSSSGGDTSSGGTAIVPSAGAPYAYGTPIGDRPPYTPLDFPLMHELRPGQRLEDLSIARPQNKPTQTGWLLLGLIAILLATGKGR